MLVLLELFKAAGLISASLNRLSDTKNGCCLKFRTALGYVNTHFRSISTSSSVVVPLSMIYRVYLSAHLKYGIYKPREVEHLIKKRVHLRTSFFSDV